MRCGVSARSSSALPYQRQQLALVGRERELAILRQCLTAARDGEGSVLLVGGDPGIGKTRLIEAALHDARTLGIVGLVGHAYDRTDTPPYGPWIDLFLRYPAAPDLPSPPPAFAERGTVGPVASQLALVA